MKEIQYSSFQTNIFEAIKTSKDHLLINAVAGSGKTFTLLESMKLVQGRCVFLAFNKSIQVELSKKVPSHVEALTLHSLGLKIITKAFGKVIVDNLKIDKAMNVYQPTATYQGMNADEYTARMEMRKSIKALISLSKSTLVDYNNDAELATVADYYGIDFDDSVLRHFRYIMNESTENPRIIDFDDMIYMPVVKKLVAPQYNYVFVDESQDLNRTQIELVLKLIGTSGRIIAVGDPKQSIYGFRGADTGAMERIKTVLNATELPLSVCYRCPTSHIKSAQTIVPYIEAAQEAIEGEIKTIKAEAFVESIMNDACKEPLVISRINAPLVGYALKLIAQGRKAIVRGSDIGKNITSIVRNLKARNINDLYSKLDIWQSKEIDKLNKRNAASSAYDVVSDKIQTIKVIADSCDSIECILNKIATIFSDEIVGTVLSTVHKAKGLEADSVYIIRPDLLPLIRKGQQAWEVEQEMNIKYVALTRAKKILTFVNN